MLGRAEDGRETLPSAGQHARRRRLRALLRECKAVPGAGLPAGTAGAPIQTPFGTARAVEGDTVSRRPVAVAALREGVAFVDGIQRFSVEGWFGVIPVVRGYVAAAALWREDGALSVQAVRTEEFLVAPCTCMPASVVDELRALGFPVYDSQVDDRRHPLLDTQRAVEVLDRRRRWVERAVVDAVRRDRPEAWIVVDGSLRGYDAHAGSERLLGVIKSHETQFLAGADLDAALTLPAGCRTTVSMRRGQKGNPVHSWYLRLWDWADRHILYGLLRIERPPLPDTPAACDAISGWLLAERAPVARDVRRDRLLYPMHQVEEVLRARAGGWQ